MDRTDASTEHVADRGAAPGAAPDAAGSPGDGEGWGSGWGTPRTQLDLGPRAVILSCEPVRERRRRWIGVVALAVVVVVGAGWLLRDPIGDALDELAGSAQVSPTRGAQERTPDATGSAGGGGSGGSDQGGAAPDDAFATALRANEESFDAWMDESEVALRGMVGEIEAASTAFVSNARDLAQDISGGSDAAASDAATLAALLDAGSETLEAAPVSVVRNAFEGVLGLQADALAAATTAIDDGDRSALEAAIGRVGSSMDETLRLCRQYGERVEAMCS